MGRVQHKGKADFKHIFYCISLPIILLIVLIYFVDKLIYLRASQVALMVKNLPANAGDVRDTGLIPGLGRSPGEGHANLLWYSCLKNPMDRGAWQATVHRVTKSWIQLK